MKKSIGFFIISLTKINLDSVLRDIVINFFLFFFFLENKKINTSTIEKRGAGTQLFLARSTNFLIKFVNLSILLLNSSNLLFISSFYFKEILLF